MLETTAGQENEKLVGSVIDQTFGQASSPMDLSETGVVLNTPVINSEPNSADEIAV